MFSALPVVTLQVTSRYVMLRYVSHDLSPPRGYPARDDTLCYVTLVMFSVLPVVTLPVTIRDVTLHGFTLVMFSRRPRGYSARDVTLRYVSHVLSPPCRNPVRDQNRTLLNVTLDSHVLTAFRA